jgi:hypothetical protein
MGHHIALLRSPPGAIPRADLSAAALALGWHAADVARRAPPRRPDRLWRGRIAVVAVFMALGLTCRLAEGWRP